MRRISSKKDLNEFLNKELGINSLPFFKRILICGELWLRGGEKWPIWRYIYALRHYEYYKNKKKLSLFDAIRKHYWRLEFRHLQVKYNIYIAPNAISCGLKLTHAGYRGLPTFCEIGENCTMLPMVLIGKKEPGIKGKIIIGNNCYISTGVTILGPITIGDNVTIGAGAVVTKDVPDHAIVAGVPAKIIKYKEI